MHAHLHTQTCKVESEYGAFSALNFKKNLEVFQKSTFIPFFCGIFKEKKEVCGTKGDVFSRMPLL